MKNFIFALLFLSFHSLASAESPSPLLMQTHLFASDRHFVGLGAEVQSYPLKLSDDDPVLTTSVHYSADTSLFEKYFVLWSPLPLGIGYSLDRTQDNWTDVSWHIPFEGRPLDTQRLIPTFSSTNSRYLGARIGYWTTFRQGFTTPIRADERWTWEGQLTTGPRFLLHKAIALGTYLQGSIQDFFFARYFGEDPSLPKMKRQSGLQLDMDVEVFKDFLLSGEYGLTYLDPEFDLLQKVYVSTSYLF